MQECGDWSFDSLTTAYLYTYYLIWTLVAAAGAAKYCWLAPLMLTRLAGGTPVGSVSYDVGGDDTAVLRRRIGLFEHLSDWSTRTLARTWAS